MNRKNNDMSFRIEDLSPEKQKKMIRDIVNLSGDRADLDKLEHLSLEMYETQGGIMKNIQEIIDSVKKGERDEEPVALFVRRDTGEQDIFPLQKKDESEEGMFLNKETEKKEAIRFPLS